MTHNPSILIMSQEKANELNKYWFNILFAIPEYWKKKVHLLVPDWKTIAISFTIGLRPFLGLSPKFNQCTRNLNKSINKELIEKINVEIGKVDNRLAKDTTKAQIHSLIFNYLYDEQTGLPVDVYTPEDVNTLAEELFKHVYVQYSDAVVNVYTQDF